MSNGEVNNNGAKVISFATWLFQALVAIILGLICWAFLELRTQVIEANTEIRALQISEGRNNTLASEKFKTVDRNTLIIEDLRDRVRVLETKRP
jgi:hypothetical protein